MTDYGTPEDPDLIREAFASAMMPLFFASPGIVQSYDDAERTVDVAPATRRPVPRADGTFATEDVPVIQNVPVLAFGGPNVTLEIGLARGDTVLLVFCDYSFAAWRSTGAVSDPLDVRKHGPSYPVAIPWYRPKGKPSTNAAQSIGKAGENSVRIHFAEDGTFIRVGKDYAATPDFVAMSMKVDAELQALKSLIAGVVPAPPSGPDAGEPGLLALQAALASWPSASVASTNLKADG